MLKVVLADNKIEDFQSLIGVAESKIIDFKRSCYELDSTNLKRSCHQHKELLKDVSSFANTVGGDLVIGVKEEDGIATELIGVDEDNFDNLKNKYHQLIQQWIQPRLDCTIQEFQISDRKYVIVIRVAQSLTAPHRVIYLNRNGAFYARNSSGVYAMDTIQLRQAFLLQSTIYEQMKTFRNQRVSLIKSGVIPLNSKPGSKMIIHMIPTASFSSQIEFTPKELKAGVPLPTAMPLSTVHGEPTNNFDGVLIDMHICSTHIQIFRNGIIEIATGDVVNRSGSQNYYIPYYENYAAQIIPECLKYYRNLGIPAPVWLFVSFTEMRGAKINLSSLYHLRNPIDRPDLLMPEVEIESFETNGFMELKSRLDMLWQAAGFDECLTFDTNAKEYIDRNYR